MTWEPGSWQPLNSRSRSVLRSCLSFRLHDHLIVDAKLTLGHSAEVGLHDNSTRHVGAQHLTCKGRAWGTDYPTCRGSERALSTKLRQRAGELLVLFSRWRQFDVDSSGEGLLSVGGLVVRG